MPRVPAFLRQTLVVCATVLTLSVCVDAFPTSPEAPAEAGSTPGVASFSHTGSGPAVLVGAGDIAHCGTNMRDEHTANLLDGIPGTVFTTGDNVYEFGTAEEYQNCYEPSWGRHKARTHPSIGDHEYELGNADPTFAYFGALLDPTGEKKGYYSYDLGNWHVIVLNSNKSYVPVAAGSVQEQWLRADLAANTKRCVVAYWHQPRYYSSTTTGGSTLSNVVKPFWDALYEYGVEVVLNGNKHHYERFAPMNPEGDVEPGRGIRQFIVGTGGKSIGRPTVNIAANSEVIGGEYGVLKLTLHEDSYDWEFVPIAGKTFRDSGSGQCHDATAPANKPPTAVPGGPYAAEGTVTFDGSRSSDRDGNLPLTYAWEFGDGATGTGERPTHSYAADGTYPVTLTVTDALGLAGDPVSTTVTIANVAPAVHAGADKATTLGDPINLNAMFSDPGPDAPWSYTISWGDGSPTESGSLSSSGDPITGAHEYGATGTFTVRVTVTDVDGGVGFDEIEVQVLPSTAGVLFTGAGDIGRCDRADDNATGALLDGIGGKVFTAGDNALWSGTSDEFLCYDAAWGRHKDRTTPAPGDKDYATVGASGYFAYFGAAAGDPSRGYYAYDHGSWRVVVLNSNISTSAGSAQEQWLRGELATNTKPCVVAVWHHPRFASSGTGSTRGSVKPLWDALYQYGAELIINAHYRFYERMAPQDPLGNATPNGIRQFIVGTGGAGTNPLGTAMPNSEARQSGTYGVLKLELRPEGYTWEFVPVAGSTYTDSGTGSCR